MADKQVVDEPEAPDPLQALLTSHIARMQTIAEDGLSHAKQVSDNLVSKLKKNVGLRNEVLDRTLSALGIKEPKE